VEDIGVTDIRIYCARDSHAPRVAEVWKLRRLPSGEWGDVPEQAHALKMASGDSTSRSLVETPFQIMGDGSGHRWARWDFRCHIDERHNVQVRQEKLFSALDSVVEAGESEVSLLALAAILERLERARSGA
jgi:hypothetical protein